MSSFRVATFALAAFAAGCATAISGSADSITKLEHARTADPRSEAVQRSLGIAYFKANRYADARSVLQQAAASDPKDGVAALYLGLTAEAQNDIPAARAAYEKYERVGKTRGVKNQINDRLVLLARKENEAAAKVAIAQEQRLSSTAGSPQTIAVLPFTFTGSDTSLKPLERGFAELITTDLSRSSKLTIVERSRLQALLDEIQLQRSAGAENGTGVRAGKMLQAGRLVGGTIAQQGTNQLRANAYVTNVQTTRNEGNANDTQSLDQLFTLEKNVVLALFADMGVALTTTERNAIEQRQTRSLAAFLAYSRGLEFQDQGRYDDAGRSFDNAVRIDPSFGAAQQKSQEAKSAAAGNQVSAITVESGLRGTSEGAAVSASSQGVTTTNSTAGTALAAADGLNPSPASGATTGTSTTTNQPAKDASSGTGGDNVATRTAKVTIVIHQPGKP
jgi:tetratricopeptide (TPR) repeat protein